MSKKIVVILPNLGEDIKEDLRETAEYGGYGIEYFEEPDAAAIAAVQDAEIILTYTESICPHASNAKWICASSAGVDKYVVPGFLPEEVILTNSSGAYGVTMSEHVVMVLLEMMRKESQYRQIVQDRRWERTLPIRSIYGSRITFLGTGDVGRKAASRMRGFEPEYELGLNRSGHFVEPFDKCLPISELDFVLPETDVLVMSLPGTPETVQIMNRERLALLPENAYLVNVGRGNAIDQKALIDLMQKGHLAGAALDVFEEEPVPQDDPIWDCPRVHLTPHTAGNMTLSHTVQFIIDMFRVDFYAYCHGLPMEHVVPRKRGY